MTNDDLLLQKSDVPDMAESLAVLLVDLSSIAHPIWHMSQAEPDPNHTSQRTAAVVRSLAHPRTAICCDSAKSFRKELDETYKANRPAQEAPLHHQIDLAREALDADGFPVWCVDGFEGDDLIATATAKLIELAILAITRVLLSPAPTKTYWPLSVIASRFTPRARATASAQKRLKKSWASDPARVADYLCLVGDASDNIKGAKGIGPKTAAEILGFYGSVEEIYAAIDVGAASSLKPAQRASLDELRPRLEAVRSLVRMRTDVPLDIDAVFKPRVPTVVEDFMEGDEMETEVNEPTASR